MPKFGNAYQDHIPYTVRLSNRNAAYAAKKANEAGTKTHIWIEELLELAFDCKRNPDTTSNTYQRLAVEAAVVSSGAEQP